MTSRRRTVDPRDDLAATWKRWIFFTVLLAAAMGAWVGSVALAEEGGTPRVPSTVPAAVAELLGDGVPVLTEEMGLTVWPVRHLATGDDGAAGLGVAFPSLPPGDLLGVLELATSWTDYKGQEIPPGVYTLRYQVEPEDGYHLGVSLYRDFALLMPAAEDSDPAPRGVEELIAAAAGAAGTKHPAVLAMWPVFEGEPGDLVDNDLGQPTLVLELAGTRVGLVLEGTGEVG
jgi:hypothetical protein